MDAGLITNDAAHLPGITETGRRDEDEMRRDEQGAERNQAEPSALFPFSNDLADKDDACQHSGEGGKCRSPAAYTPCVMLQDVLPNSQSHDHDRQEHAYSVERNCDSRLASYEQHDDYGEPEGNRHRTGERAPRIPLNNDFGDFPNSYIAPFCGLGILKCCHRRCSEHCDGQNLVGPEQDQAPRDFRKPYVSQVSHQCAAERTVKSAEMDCKESEEKRGYSAVEQERCLYEAARSQSVRCKSSRPIQAFEMLSFPTSQA